MKLSVGQFDRSDCGAACLASIARYYHLKLPVWKIRQLAGTNRIGTSAYGLVKAAEQIGLEAKGVELECDDLAEIPLPAIVHLKLKKGGHHFVVLYKVSKRKVTVMDPAQGRMIQLSMEEFLAQWTGIAILMIPGLDFQAGNEKKSNLSRFAELIKPHRKIFLQSGIGALAFTIMGLSTAVYIQKLTDFVLVGHNRNLLHLMGVIMLGILLFQVIIGALQSIFVLRVGQNIDSVLITGYYKHLLRLPQRFFDSMRVGELISRVNDAVKIRSFINQVAVEAVVDGLIIIMAFLLMLAVNWKLALFTYTVLPVYGLIYYFTNFFNRKVERKQMEQTAELETQLVESLRSVKTIKQMGAERYFTNQAEGKLLKVLDQVYVSGKTNIFSSSSMMMINRLLTVAILWMGAGFVIDSYLTPGELMSFFAITGFFTGPVSRLIAMNKSVQGALIASDRLFEILDLERETNVKAKLKLSKAELGDIAFQKVQFSYTLEQDLFDDLSFTIKKGQITALLGDSGSGKSTIGHLIQGLYQISGGKISIGQCDLRYVDPVDLRRMVGVVSQQIELFAGNVIENIALGDERPDMNRLNTIIQQLDLNDVIDVLPEGLYTWLGENANQLSGGQRQRLAIARVMYLNPEVYIFDEATSFLDDRSEKIIKELMLRLQKEGKTIIMVAHRMSIIDIADQIYVFRKGQVEESGSYQQLIQNKGRFSEMVQHQVGIPV